MIKHPIFDILSEDEYKEAIKFFKENSYKKDEIIVEEGKFSDKAFILLDGEVDVIKATIYNNDYIATTIKAPAVEFFGEINLIDRGLVTSTIKANVDLKVLEITHDEFINLMDSYPKIGAKLLWVISRDLAKYLRKADKDVLTLFNALVEIVEND